MTAATVAGEARGRGRPATLGALLERAAGSLAGVRFLDRDERPDFQRYADLLAGARAVARGLAARGLAGGDRVALVLPTGADFYHAFFGALLAGLVPVPLYPPVRLGRLAEYHERTAAMLRACGAALVVSDARVGRLLGVALAAARPRAGQVTAQALRAAGEGAAGAESGPPADPDAPAFLQFSSGTTGAPRPVTLTHRQVLANVDAIVAAILAAHPEGPGCRHAGVSWLPLYHDMGLVGCVLTALAHPADLTLLPPELFVARPAAWLRAISRWRATVSPAPNFAYALCADRVPDEERAGLDLSSWRVALNGAEPVTPEVLQRFVARFVPVGFRPEALTPVYGLSEATLAVTFAPLDQPFRAARFDVRALAAGRARPSAGDGRALVALGRPLPGLALRIAGEDGAPLSEGRVGRVLVRGPSVMAGYWDEAAETARVLDADGWLDTGDLGFLHDGELFLHGRRKDLIVLRGRNHAPQEVEQALDGLPGVRPGCAAALGVVPPGGDGEVLMLLVERARTATPRDDEALAGAIRDAVSERTGLVPAQVVLLPPGTLPRTSSGKLRRAAARQAWEAGTLRPPGRVTPLRMLAALVRSRLAR
jgi:acyl-CoA synthetase (AMP-forming)/AMP-acid ligase II